MICVLIVDNDAGFLVRAAKVVQKVAGVTVTIAGSATAVAEQLSQTDVIVLGDLGPAGMRSSQLLTHIDAKIAIISVSSEEAVRERASAHVSKTLSHFDEYLSKAIEEAEKRMAGN